MPSQLRFPLFSYPWLLLASLLLVLSAGRSAQAQGPNWQTALAIPQTANAFTHILQTAADGNGNVYVAGTFSGSITLGTTTLTARFSQLFVAKWSSTTGQFVWGITQGDALSPNGLAVQGTSVYVSASTTAPTGYVIKVTDAGVSASVGWVQTFPNALMGELAAVGPSVYLYGSFSDPTLTLGTTTLTNTGFSSLFVAKLTDAGATATYTWAVKAGGSGSASSASAHRLAVQGSAVYLAGDFTASLTFGPTQVTSTGQGDVFISKLTDNASTAQFVWTKTISGSSNDYAYGLCVSGTSVYVGGAFFSPTLTCGSTTLSNMGAINIFITKLTDAGSTGTFTWAQRGGGSGSDVLNGLLVQGATVYAYGYFGPSTSTTFGSSTLANAGNYDGFVTALTDAGTTSSFSWASSIGSTSGERITAMSATGSTLYVAADLSSPSVSFGSHVVTNSSGYAAGCLASFTPTVLAASSAKLLIGSSLYPNPASGSTRVQLPAVPGATYATLTVRNLLGQAVRTSTVTLPATGLTYELGLAGLAKGLYQVHLQAGEYAGIQRLAVE